MANNLFICRCHLVKLWLHFVIFVLILVMNAVRCLMYLPACVWQKWIFLQIDVDFVNALWLISFLYCPAGSSSRGPKFILSVKIRGGGYVTYHQSFRVCNACYSSGKSIRSYVCIVLNEDMNITSILYKMQVNIIGEDFVCD